MPFIGSSANTSSYDRYIGRSPTVAKYNKVYLDGSFDGVTATFNMYFDSALTIPAAPAPNQCMFSLSDEVLDPGIDFTISGTQVTFDINTGTQRANPVPVAADYFFGVVIGETYDTKVPESFSVITSSIQDGAIIESKMAADSVNTNALVTNSVTTEKIAALNVTNAKLAANSVTSSKIADASITRPGQLQDLVVTEAKLASGAVTTGKIGDSQVTTGKIQAGAVTETRIADRAVTATKLANTEAVITVDTQFSDSVISTNKLADDAVTFQKIDDATAGNALGARYIRTAFDDTIASPQNGDIQYVVEI